jgi:hypothetical protein
VTFSSNRLVLPLLLVRNQLVNSSPMTEPLSLAVHSTLQEGYYWQICSLAFPRTDSQRGQLGKLMASLDGSVELLQSFLVPVASSAFQSRLANVSALVLQIYDWCRSPNRSCQHTSLRYFIYPTKSCALIKRYERPWYAAFVVLNADNMPGRTRLGMNTVIQRELMAKPPLPVIPANNGVDLVSFGLGSSPNLRSSEG